jgi:hypothetical protein
MKRLVLMGEGEGERESLFVLTKKLLDPIAAWDTLWLDSNVITVGDLPGLLSDSKRKGQDQTKWLSRLRHATKRSNLGAILVVLDGDAKNRALEKPFCAREHAKQLGLLAASIGAGTLFSMAIVFACKEYESWLIAGVESLAGKTLRDGLEGIPTGTTAPTGDLEQAPRDAKKWLSDHMKIKYRPARDQSHFTRLVSIDLIRNRRMRSFARMENAVRQIVDSIRSGQALVSPT